MGNRWKGISAERLYECETEMLLLHGIPTEAYTIRNVSLSADEDNYIHEIRVKGYSEDLPTLVMIHGYMAGGM